MRILWVVIVFFAVLIFWLIRLAIRSLLRRDEVASNAKLGRK